MFISEASKDTLLYHILRDLNGITTQKHQETLTQLKKTPDDRK